MERCLSCILSTSERTGILALRRQPDQYSAESLPLPALVPHLIWRTIMRQGAVRIAHQSSLARFVTVGWVWIVLAFVGTSPVMAQGMPRVVSIEGAGPTYQSIDRDGKPVTVRVPSQSAADIKGKDVQGNVTGTVTALDLTQRRVKAPPSPGQTIVLELSP